MNKISQLTAKLANEISVPVNHIDYGYKIVNGQKTDELSIIFGITEKKPLSALSPNEILPSTVVDEDGIVYKTDVLESAPIQAAYCYTDSESIPPVSQHRTANRVPLVGGIRIYGNGYWGTLGCLCVDLTDNTIVALTNAHIGVDGNKFLAAESYDVVPFNNSNYSVTQGTATLRLKRYSPATTYTAFRPNLCETAVMAITNSSLIDTLSSFKQLNLNYGNLPFATTEEIDNLVVNKNPIFKAGAKTGPVGWPGSSPWGSETCSLTAESVNSAANVQYSYNGSNITRSFQDTIRFRGENTVGGDSGDSGSIVCALINPQSPTLSAWKIVGNFFAAQLTITNGRNCYATRIDNICNVLQLTAWNGQDVNLTNLGKQSFWYIDGPTPLQYYDNPINGKRYWQVGLVNS